MYTVSCVYFIYPLYYREGMKTIKVSDENHKKLTELVTEFGQTLDDVIGTLLEKKGVKK